MTEQQALDEAREYWRTDVYIPYIDIPIDEEVVALASLLKATYEKGLEEGTSRDAKEMFWVGVISGIERFAWWAGGKRYVGAIATPFTEYGVIIKGILRERDEALGK